MLDFDLDSNESLQYLANQSNDSSLVTGLINGSNRFFTSPNDDQQQESRKPERENNSRLENVQNSMIKNKRRLSNQSFSNNDLVVKRYQASGNDALIPPTRSTLNCVHNLRSNPTKTKFYPNN